MITVSYFLSHIQSGNLSRNLFLEQKAVRAVALINWSFRHALKYDSFWSFFIPLGRHMSRRRS